MKKLIFILTIIIGSFTILKANNPLDTNWRDYFVVNNLNPTGIISNIYIHQDNIYLMGAFDGLLGQKKLNGLAFWDDSTWSPIGYGDNIGTNGFNNAMIYNNGLYIGGYFDSIGSISVNRIAKWDGTNWHSLGQGVNGIVTSMAVKDTMLYVAGRFDSAGTTPVNNIAIWNGSNWNSFSGGTNGAINDMIIKDDYLYIIGEFDTVSNVYAKNLARYDFINDEWGNIGVINGKLMCIYSYSDDIYVGGEFDTVNYNNNSYYCRNIAIFSNNDWSNLDNIIDGVIMDITTQENKLYIGGVFNSTTELELNNLAIWDGFSWSQMGSGVDGMVYTLANKDNYILVGGLFFHTGEIFSQNIGIWSTIPLDENFKLSNIDYYDISSFNYTKKIFPNPSSDNIKIQININKVAKLKICLFDSNGKLIEILTNSLYSIGDYQFINKTENLPIGTYYYEFDLDGQKSIEKIVIMR